MSDLLEDLSLIYILPIFLVLSSLKIAEIYATNVETYNKSLNKFVHGFIVSSFIITGVGSGGYIGVTACNKIVQKQADDYSQLLDNSLHPTLKNNAFYISSFSNNKEIKTTDKYIKINVLKNDVNFKNDKINITSAKDLDKNSLVLYNSKNDPVTTLTKPNGVFKVENNTIVFTPNNNLKSFEQKKYGVSYAVARYGASANGVKYYSSVHVRKQLEKL